MADALATVDDDKLDVGKLVAMFEASEEATYEARQEAERDRDYYDNKQWTDEEVAVLNKRKQPALTDNRIKTKIDFLIGLEKQQRIDPRALPRTPAHEEDADGASQALKYVSDTEDYDGKRSGVWRNLMIEGSGGIGVAVEQKPYGSGGQPEWCIKLRRIAWDRMFADPHSSEPDYSDATYLGVVLWMDYDDALRQYPDAKDALDATMAERGNLSETFDDKPKFRLWADKTRKRIRVCQIWIKRGDEWHFAEFTKGGILKAGPSPYKTDTGESDCELFFQSAYVDRDNNRYGLVREMISLQDGINKRKSKALHLLNTVQTVYEDGYIDDIEAFRREMQKPDGVGKVNPGGLTEGRVKVEARLDLAATHFQLLQEDQNSIDLKGPNATMMGEKAQGSSAASGRAILASQQGGMIQLGDLLDNLRHLDKRVFRAIWNRIRQFWTGEKWVRITDDERNVKWVAMNVDQMQIQMAMQQNPEMAQRIAGVVGNVAELDCDIIIDEVPDAVTPALEQWQGLVDLAQAGVPIPPDVLVQSAPNLKNKTELLEKMNEPNPANEIRMRGEAAKVADTEAAAKLKQAQTMKTMVDAQLAPQQIQADMMGNAMGEPGMGPVESQKVAAEAEDKLASADLKRAQTFKTVQEARLMPQQMAMDAQNRAADRQMNFQNAAEDRKIKAKQAQQKARAPA